jgi:GNAT superfamily N-acetyltransferase
MSEYRVCLSRPELAVDLAQIQRLCFPTVAEHELITAAQYRAHIERFPDGQFVLLNSQDQVVGGSTSCRCQIDLAHYHHTYMEAAGQNWLDNHNPHGDWLYGIDLGVHPQHRSRGLSKLIYDARKDLARRLGLRGILIGGMLKGFASYRDKLSATEYLAQVESGALFDPTVSVQLRRGFAVHGLLPHYIHDPTIDGAAALLIWRSDSFAASV